MKPNSHLIGLVALCGIFFASEALAFYNPQIGRWVSRDPIAEEGFRRLNKVESDDQSNSLALYAFLANAPISEVDSIGLLRFQSDCSPADIATMKAALTKRCAAAKKNNCFRCFKNKHQARLAKFCNEINKNVGPKVYCKKDSQKKWCKDQKGCAYTTVANNIVMCVDRFNDKTNCSEVGCTLLHEAGHAVGGVGDDTNPKSPKSDNKAYAIQKCAGCTIPPGITLPPGY